MNRPAFLEQTETMFLVEHLAWRQNGVNKSVLRQIRYMEDEWDYYPTLLTTLYNPALWATKHDLGLKTNVIGMFEYLCNAYPLNAGVQRVAYERCTPMPGVTYEEVEPDVYKVFKNGQHTETQAFVAGGGKLRTIENFDGNGTRLNTTWFDDAGQLIRMTIWDVKNPDFHPQEYYFTPEKQIRIQAQYAYEPDIRNVKDPLLAVAKDHNVLVQYTLFGKNGQPEAKVHTHSELVAFCLDKMASETDKVLIAIDESMTYSDGVALTKAPNIARACVFHSTFLSNPYDVKSPINPFYIDVCKNHDLFDAVVFLTKDEKNDFVKRFEFSNNYYVIPHTYTDALPHVQFEQRDGRKIVIVSRFDPIKRIHLSIDIFKLVAEKLEDVTLDIYGFGAGASDTTNAMKEQIERLGLTERVFLKGNTDNPAEVFSGAALFMMTSRMEGFGMTMMESICNGCPAFAFDIKYGPSDIIKNGETGYLFKDNDVASFASKVVAYLEDEDLRRRMSEDCYADAERFNKETFLDNWASVMETMYRRCEKH